MKIVNDPQDSQINSLAPCGKSASLTTSVHAEDDTDYYCFSWAEGLKVCTVLQAREVDKNLLPAQPWGSQGKVSAPPFLESMRPRNPAVWVSPDFSSAAPSARLPSLGQRRTRGGHTPLDEGAAHSSCPRFPGWSQQHRTGGSVPPLLGHWAANAHP